MTIQNPKYDCTLLNTYSLPISPKVHLETMMGGNVTDKTPKGSSNWEATAVVIGGGFSGLSSAAELSSNRKIKVTLVEAADYLGTFPIPEFIIGLLHLNLKSLIYNILPQTSSLVLSCK